MENFSKKSFLDADGEHRSALCNSLGAALHERLQSGPDFHEGVHLLVDELRTLGHDLWSFDESDDMEVWCPNYQQPSGPGIVITFSPDEVVVEWSYPPDEQHPFAT